MPQSLDAIAACPVLIKCRKNGKQAIKHGHKDLFPVTIQHSIDFENAADQWKVKQSLNRYDYLVHSNRINAWSAVEIHSADASHVIQKKKDTQAILDQHCPSMSQAIKNWFLCPTADIHRHHKRRISEAGIQTIRNLTDKL